MDHDRRVVVTGLGVIAPNAHGAAAFAGALREGKSGIRFHQHLADLGFGCQVGGIPEGLEAIQGRYLDEDELRAMNPNMVYAAIAAIDAWTDAGLERPARDGGDVHWDTGAIIGTGIGGIDTIAEKLVPRVDAGKVSRLGSTMVEQIMSSGNTARVAGLLALGNKVTTSSSACNTGTEAIIDAFLHIREGRAERMLAGGSEGHSKYIWAGFDAMKVLCRTHNGAPAEASRPMSASAAGFVPGSGAGVLVLESLESAERRGARIYAEVLGGYVNCGGHRLGGSMTAPNSEAVRRCIRGALAMANVQPEEIGAINGHLTATFADPREIASWSAALELPPERMPLLHSTKSLIGHALGAAGGIECVASVLELHQGFVHGSLNCRDLHPELAAYAKRIPHRTVDVPDLRVIAKASFGFGDVNGCVVFGKQEKAA
ncbi:3-oxoacyl-[acyl-carrier-protein] synthase, KASI [Labilithrix luteola]|uniref:3-oxoacyl-[acyl-carrier-protein] synthase 1 n=1 Tax=Labilithrix luteola TaxID=1391654 RepID=A0A0K1PR07_9BACT|nr:3-oxoacyl-[acyl-carrier-protein] synthase, KASI [Labilithrix luteola]